LSPEYRLDGFKLLKMRRCVLPIQVMSDFGYDFQRLNMCRKQNKIIFFVLKIMYTIIIHYYEIFRIALAPANGVCVKACVRWGDIAMP
jgi:hypothetical protein